MVREKSGKFKIRESRGILKKGQRNLGKSFENEGKLTFLSHARKVKQIRDFKNWKCMGIAIQQKLKCNVDLEDPTLIGYTI